ncbi:FtsX-like permease family protein [Actinokineospora iranica]|uniref:FtsX-like permease family protein n=1 Tax=Actinokineospora iranica TaxID=1271860 RepID=A0A1G6QKL2_9PSEU|nr:FtsX-like permease family protein [Actinokineospora iranica]SDC92960.1 FtsX-like permease family protein [Actinokineospora iranica]
MRAWLNDLAIGVRLAVGGGRTSLARFVLSTVGVGIAVAVLLLASSVGPVLDARDQRTYANLPDATPAAGVAPTHYARETSEFGEKRVNVIYLLGEGPTSPKPPGIATLPGEDEMYVSPALAALLGDPANTLLRERFPQRIVGTLSDTVVEKPTALLLYTGAGPQGREAPLTAYAFGIPHLEPEPMDPGLLLLLLLGTVALLVPVFIFLASSTRIAGAERDRRLSALRLVGSDSGQVRRIAAAETLVGALAGLLLGGALFLLGREMADDVELMNVSVYPADIVPTWWLAVLVLLAVPVLAVLTAQFALRRTIIEPLGVVRHSKPVRRRLVWRVAVVALGVVLLVWHGGVDANSQLWSYSIATGATLILLGVPILLPYLVEHTVSRLRGGPSSWQLAIRRLQLDSGTSARVVGGVATVLAGAVALQAVLLTQAGAFSVPDDHRVPSDVTMTVFAGPEVAEEAERIVKNAEGTLAVSSVQSFSVQFSAGESSQSLIVADCDTVRSVYAVDDCVDGQVFSPHYMTPEADGFLPGRTVRVVDYDGGSEPKVLAEWTYPASTRRLPPATIDRFDVGGLLATPGALPDLPGGYPTIRVQLDPAVPQAAEHVRNALQSLRWRAWSSLDNAPVLSQSQREYLTIRRGLLVGSVFTLLLGGISLLVLALEHIRERRRPLAILAASGVPTGALARSLLWQIAIPIALGVAVAVPAGIGLATLITNLSADLLRVDWPGVAIMTAAAAALGLLVSLLTLPFLRSATRLDALRTE